MKKPVNRLICCTTAGLLMLVGFVVSVRAQSLPHVHTERCATSAVEQLRRLRDPARLRQADRLEQLVQQQIQKQRGSARLADDNTIYRIPVVVHVVHNNSSNFIGGSNNPNISDEQILSQIRVLNEDYRRAVNTNGYNTHPNGADTGIEFYLANSDPEGKATNGITRHYYSQKTVFNPYDSSDLLQLSSVAYWPSDRYLNIWVTSLQGATIGYAQFPTAADTLQGLTAPSDERLDGVVISYTIFGANACTPAYRLYCQGRTTTHEIGHWLGLFHINRDYACGDDFVYDTPTVEALNNGTTCGPIFSECVPGRRTQNMIENYMDYSPDACMNIFTKGQRERMRAVLQVSDRRRRLIESVMNPVPESETLTVLMFPNPAQSTATAEVRFQGAHPLTVDVLDLSGRLIRTQNLSTTISTRLSIPVSGLPKGMYVVRVKTDNETASTRLLVN